LEDGSALDTYLAIYTERLDRISIEPIKAKKFVANQPLTAITQGPV
jgi:hypothetical protein